MLPSGFFHRNVVLSFQEDAIGIRLRDVIGVDNMMWGSDYPHSESTFPQ
jgi:predicted TIM-barrel fold metal-dependent hydrolase